MLWIIGSLLFGAALGAAAISIASHAPQSSSEIDYEGDGRSDEFAYYFGERLQRVETDRNRDGKIDQTLYYDADAFIARDENDDDFDGRAENLTRYRDGQATDTNVDFDGDGRPEYRAYYRFGVYLREEFMGTDGILFKRIEYKNGWPHTGN